MEGLLSKPAVLPVQVQLLGQSISVGRPSGYVDPSRAQEAAAAAAAALQAFQVRRICQACASMAWCRIGLVRSVRQLGMLCVGPQCREI